MILTTTNSIEGYKIIDYKGIVTGISYNSPNSDKANMSFKDMFKMDKYYEIYASGLEKIKEAAAEAQRILHEARGQSKALLEQKVQEASLQAEALIRKAGEATELERQKMLTEVKQEVARLVVDTSAKVLDRELSVSDRERYANSATDTLSKSLT